MHLSRLGRRLGVAAALILALAPAQLGAQQGTASGAASIDTAAARRLLDGRLPGQGNSQAEVVERLRRSGMSRSQARAGLERMGYDPGLADRYFDVLEGRLAAPDGEAPRSHLEALNALGVPAVAHADQLEIASPWADSAAAAAPRPGAGAGPELFGLELFRRFTTQFDAPLSGPVDPGYRLGAGDELSLILTGEVESSWAMEVTREGFVVIPDIGQLFVSGLTLTDLEDRLYDHLGRHYSGVRRSDDAPIRFHVGLRRLRTSAVYVIGEAVRPGAYQVSSVGTVLNALYLAGGPSGSASFRAIEVRRAGGVAATLDLYDYLLDGDTRADVRLEHGDVVFVPTTGARVTVEGAVRRPAIYELREGEGVADAIRYAGGLSSEASSHRTQIDRILAAGERRPGVDRVVVDVDAARLAAGEGVALKDGDVVRAFEVLSERRNRIVLTGEVNRPGVYEWSAGMTLGQLLARADGLAEHAYTSRTHVFRLNPKNGERHLLRVEEGAFDVTPLMDRDSVVVYGMAELSNPRFVWIDGFVKSPGVYELARGMTVQDLVLAAGGFAQGAHTVEAELARMPNHADGSGATVSRVRLGGSPDPETPDVLRWAPSAQEVRLEHGDRVFIRKAADFEPIGTVQVTGEVLYPGAYALTDGTVRLSDILKRAGGPEPEAHVQGTQLVRAGRRVAADLGAALARPGSPSDIVLLESDSIFVPRLDETVLVRGAVGFETRVRYESGRGLDWYIERAGGWAQNADRGRTTVTQQNGARSTVKSRLLLPDSKPTPGPGSTVFVPAEPERPGGGINIGAVLTRVVAIASAVATVFIAFK